MKVVKPQMATLKDEMRFRYYGGTTLVKDADDSLSMDDERLDEVALLMQDPTYRPGFEDIKRLYKSVKSDNMALCNLFPTLKNNAPIHTPLKFTINYLAKRQESHL